MTVRLPLLLRQLFEEAEHALIALAERLGDGDYVFGNQYGAAYHAMHELDRMLQEN